MELIVKKFDELTAKELYEILSARMDIFLIEQNIHYNDLDGIDYRSYHFYFWDKGKIVAYLRAFYEDDTTKENLRIGRVLTRNHGNGLGKKLLNETLNYIKHSIPCQKVCMDAQQHAIGFYEKIGFHVVSEPFLEEGVWHVKMELSYDDI